MSLKITVKQDKRSNLCKNAQELNSKGTTQYTWDSWVQNQYGPDFLSTSGRQAQHFLNVADYLAA